MSCTCRLDLRSSHANEAFCLTHKRYHLYCDCPVVPQSSPPSPLRMSAKEAALYFPITCNPESLRGEYAHLYNPPEWVY